MIAFFCWLTLVLEVLEARLVTRLQDDTTMWSSFHPQQIHKIELLHHQLRPLQIHINGHNQSQTEVG